MDSQSDRTHSKPTRSPPPLRTEALSRGDPGLATPWTPSLPVARPRQQKPSQALPSPPPESPPGEQQQDAEGGEMVRGRFRILSTLGEGSFSTVKLAVDLGRSEGQPSVALKMVRRNSEARLTLHHELELLRTLRHPNIIQLYHLEEQPLPMTSEKDDAPCFFLVLEPALGGELFDLVAHRHQELTPAIQRHIFRGLAQAVDYLHDHGVVHRDLKLENVLLTADPLSCPLHAVQTKLTDFGLATRFDPSRPYLTARCGSEEYAAPEIVVGRAYDGRETDAWSMGVVLYALIVGRLPFEADAATGQRGMLHRIARGEYAPLPSHRGDESVRELIDQILQPTPARRLKTGAILAHPWLSPS
ncbi:uncharacterized protein VTP21DRAFT_5418 [Calcarisporiella thermophila]|uniref:uncharacterized protein n=1 Tax=Calcarisporiella thermophila TaxID=911321 RepID=UPI003744A67E